MNERSNNSQWLEAERKRLGNRVTEVRNRFLNLTPEEKSLAYLASNGNQGMNKVVSGKRSEEGKVVLPADRIELFYYVLGNVLLDVRRPVETTWQEITYYDMYRIPSFNTDDVGEMRQFIVKDYFGGDPISDIGKKFSKIVGGSHPSEFEDAYPSPNKPHDLGISFIHRRKGAEAKHIYYALDEGKLVKLKVVRRNDYNELARLKALGYLLRRISAADMGYSIPFEQLDIQVLDDSLGKMDQYGELLIESVKNSIQANKDHKTQKIDITDSPERLPKDSLEALREVFTQVVAEGYDVLLGAGRGDKRFHWIDDHDNNRGLAAIDSFKQLVQKSVTYYLEPSSNQEENLSMDEIIKRISVNARMELAFAPVVIIEKLIRRLLRDYSTIADLSKPANLNWDLNHNHTIEPEATIIPGVSISLEPNGDWYLLSAFMTEDQIRKILSRS